MSDLISRQAAIAVAKGPVVMQGIRSGKSETAAAVDAVKCIIADGLRDLPPAQPEKLTDIEQRIFLAAMSKEEKVCRQVDKESNDADCINLMRVCKSIERKVKGALWT